MYQVRPTYWNTIGVGGARQRSARWLSCRGHVLMLALPVLLALIPSILSEATEDTHDVYCARTFNGITRWEFPCKCDPKYVENEICRKAETSCRSNLALSAGGTQCVSSASSTGEFSCAGLIDGTYPNVYKPAMAWSSLCAPQTGWQVQEWDHPRAGTVRGVFWVELRFSGATTFDRIAIGQGPQGSHAFQDWTLYTADADPIPITIPSNFNVHSAVSYYDFQEAKTSDFLLAVATSAEGETPPCEAFLTEFEVWSTTTCEEPPFLCQPGQTLDLTRMMCMNCQAGTYSSVRGGRCFACPYPERCVGGAACATGYAGELCGQCSAGYYVGHSKCSACESVPWKLVLATIALLLIVLLLLLGVLTINVVTRAKILVNFLQMVAFTSYAWPASARAGETLFSFIDLSLEYECVVEGLSWYGQFVGVVGFTGSIVLVVVVTDRLLSARLRANRQVKHRASIAVLQQENVLSSRRNNLRRMLLFGLNGLYIPFTRLCIQSFFCVAGSTGPVLLRDTSVLCGTEHHTRIVILAVVCIAIITVGTPSFISLFTLQLRRQGQLFLHGPTLATYGSMYESYAEKWAYMEGIYLLRRGILLVLSEVLIKSRVMENAIAIGINAAFLLFVWRAKPFARYLARTPIVKTRRIDCFNMLEIVSSSVIILNELHAMAAVGGLMGKAEISTGIIMFINALVVVLFALLYKQQDDKYMSYQPSGSPFFLPADPFATSDLTQACFKQKELVKRAVKKHDYLRALEMKVQLDKLRGKKLGTLERMREIYQERCAVEDLVRVCKEEAQYTPPPPPDEEIQEELRKTEAQHRRQNTEFRNQFMQMLAQNDMEQVEEVYQEWALSISEHLQKLGDLRRRADELEDYESARMVHLEYEGLKLSLVHGRMSTTTSPVYNTLRRSLSRRLSLLNDIDETLANSALTEQDGSVRARQSGGGGGGGGGAQVHPSWDTGAEPLHLSAHRATTRRSISILTKWKGTLSNFLEKNRPRFRTYIAALNSDVAAGRYRKAMASFKKVVMLQKKLRKEGQSFILEAADNGDIRLAKTIWLDVTHTFREEQPPPEIEALWYHYVAERRQIDKALQERRFEDAAMKKAALLELLQDRIAQWTAAFNNLKESSEYLQALFMLSAAQRFKALCKFPPLPGSSGAR